MAAYSLIFLLLLFGVFHFDIRKNTFLEKFYYFLVFLVMTTMTVMRYRVGGDSLAYEDYFRYLPRLQDLQYFILKKNELQYQPLYLLFVALCKEVLDDYYFYQIIHGVVVNIILFWFISKNSRYKFSVLLVLYFFLFYFYFTFEIQREILAICCFLIAYQYFEKNKWLQYYTFAFIAFFFHLSAFIMFLLPLFKLIKFNRKFIIISIMITLPFIFLKETFYNLASAFFINEAMQSKGEVYSKMEFSIVGVLSFYIARVILIIPFLFLSLKNRDSKDWLLSAFLILAIFSQIMVGLDRLLNYVYIPYIIFVVDQVYTSYGHTVRSSLKKKLINSMVFLNLFFVLGYKVVLDLNVTDRARYQAVFFPYGSVIEQERHIEREKFMRELWLR